MKELQQDAREHRLKLAAASWKYAIIGQLAELKHQLGVLLEKRDNLTQQYAEAKNSIAGLDRHNRAHNIQLAKTEEHL